MYKCRMKQKHQHRTTDIFQLSYSMLLLCPSNIPDNGKVKRLPHTGMLDIIVYRHGQFSGLLRNGHNPMGGRDTMCY